MDEKIRLLTKSITRAELKAIAEERFGDMVKAVVDIDTGQIAIGGELHADEESFLLESGSKQQNLWGINIYPESPALEFIEFDSMINIRPGQGNRSRSVENPEVQEKIRTIITKLMLDL